LGYFLLYSAGVLTYKIIKNTPIRNFHPPKKAVLKEEKEERDG